MKLDQLISRIGELCNDGALVIEPERSTPMGRRVLWCNDAVCRETGFSKAELIGRVPTGLFNHEGGRTAERLLENYLDQDEPFFEEVQLSCKNGTKFWCEVSCSPVFDDAGRLVYWLFFLRDVSERVTIEHHLKAARRMARQAEDRLRSAIDAIPGSFMLFDESDRLLYANLLDTDDLPEDLRIYVGLTFEEVTRRYLDRGMFPDAVGREEEWFDACMKHHRNPENDIIRELPEKTFVRVSEVRTATNDTVILATDVTNLKRQEEELRSQTDTLIETMRELETASRTDALTELGNRRGLDLEIDEIERGVAPDQPVAFLHIDLDRFKPINDVFGHAAGDHLLKVVADILKTAAGRYDYAARVGGDEFAVLLVSRAQMPMEEKADQVASQIIKACSQPISWNENKLHFGTSIGIAVGQARDMQQMMLDADIALYQAKDNGRGQSALFTPQLRRIVEQRKRLADEFLTGLADGDVIAHYQPQIEAISGKVCGAEALVRWNHKTRGVMPPGVFLPIVEDLGLLADLDTLVLHHALETAETCNKAGAPLPKVSVNISYRRIQMLKSLDALQALQPWPCKLSFELLEAIDFDEEKNALSWTLDGLRDLDIGIEIDDFGSGRASLTTLLNIRPDRLKIDRRIVSEALAPNEGAKAMIRAIGTMARGLGINMTAEGVETQEQAIHMRQMGCDVLQGYYFSKPMARENLVDWIKTAQFKNVLEDPAA